MHRLHVARFVVVLGLTVLSATRATGTDAEPGDGWSIVVTPQVWFSHISNNGFAPPPPLGFVVGASSGFNPSNFTVTSQPTSAIDPQWGLQIAAQKDQWTLSLAGQYVSFQTRYDIDAAVPFLIGNFQKGFVLIKPGQQLIQEFVDTQRLDIDFAVTHFVPDVVKDVIDINAGVGFKFIYASANRNFANGVPLADGVPLQGLYGQNCPNVITSTNVLSCQIRDRVSVDDYYYGVTLPLSASFALSDSRKWIALVNMSPFLGAETLDNHGTVYSATQTGPDSFTVQNVGGTTFAYGVTADAGLRYVFDNGITVYGGFRVQYIKGHQEYLAWGPLINMSVRFGQ